MKTIITILMITLTQIGYTQNLVPNPSFEDTLNCPNGAGQVTESQYWEAWRNTPDYFNTCADSASFMHIPHSAFGFQQAYNGNAYMGFWTFGFSGLYREIIGVHLLSPMQVGQKYFVRFRVNVSNGGYKNFQWASNKLGALFTTTAYSFSNPIPIGNFAHVYTDSIVKDTTNWTTIRGIFIADSSYQYMALGNFFDNGHTDTFSYAHNSLGAYYFIDDICVSVDSNRCDIPFGLIERKMNSPLFIYPNPANSFINIVNETNNLATIQIFDQIGNLILSRKNCVNNTSISIADLTPGIYFIRLIASKEIYSTKLVIN